MTVTIELGTSISGHKTYTPIDSSTGEPVCGFFSSLEEAEKYIKSKGWELIGEVSPVET